MTVHLSRAEFNATADKIAALQERATKKGFTGSFGLEVVSVTVTEETDDFGFTMVREMLEVEITGEAPKYDGWTFAATLDMDEHAGLIVRAVPGAPVIDRDAIVEGHCDHCGVQRFRRQTYVVLSETGEQKQVGSSCIKDFLGQNAPIVFFYDDVQGNIDDFRNSGFGGFDLGESTDYVLAVAWAATQAFGYVRTGQGNSTREVVEAVLRGRSKADREIAAALAPFVADAHEMATKVRAFILSDEFSGSSDYVLNLKAIAAADVVSSRNIGFLVSAPQAWAKAQERSLIREKIAQQPSDFFGQVGDKKVPFTGILTSVDAIDGNYGTTYLYTLRNEETGNVAKWFASSMAMGYRENVGKTFTLVGTIKAHDEYQGRKATILTRCRVA